MRIQPFTVVAQRIETLKQHLRTRRGQRDLQARRQLVELEAQRDKRTATLDSFDRLLKNYYTLENCPPNTLYLLDTTLFSTLTKDRTPMKYLNEERFIVNSNDPQAQKNYAEGWERTFGEKKEELKECTGGYYDGVDNEGNPIGYPCTNHEGCGLQGCPCNALAETL